VITITRTPPRRFFVGFSLTVGILVLAGFARTFFIPLARQRLSAPWFVYLHGTLFLSWVALLIAQSLLIATRHVSWHRRLGPVGAGLVPAMVASGVAVAIWATARDVKAGQGDSAIGLFFGELMDMALFAGLGTAALLTRHRPEVHKRLILLATLALLGAAVGRIPILGKAANLVTFFLLATVAGRDLVRLGRVHSATLWGGLVLVAGILVQTPVGATSLWLSVGRRVLNVLQY
jgi:hypothetical protein